MQASNFLKALISDMLDNPSLVPLCEDGLAIVKTALSMDERQAQEATVKDYLTVETPSQTVEPPALIGCFMQVLDADRTDVPVVKHSLTTHETPVPQQVTNAPACEEATCSEIPNNSDAQDTDEAKKQKIREYMKEKKRREAAGEPVTDQPKPILTAEERKAKRREYMQKYYQEHKEERRERDAAAHRLYYERKKAEQRECAEKETQEKLAEQERQFLSKAEAAENLDPDTAERRQKKRVYMRNFRERKKTEAAAEQQQSDRESRRQKKIEYMREYRIRKKLEAQQVALNAEAEQEQQTAEAKVDPIEAKRARLKRAGENYRKNHPERVQENNSRYYHEHHDKILAKKREKWAQEQQKKQSDNTEPKVKKQRRIPRAKVISQQDYMREVDEYLAKHAETVDIAAACGDGIVTDVQEWEY